MSSAIVKRIKPASLLAAVILLAVLAALPVGPGRSAGRRRYPRFRQCYNELALQRLRAG